MWSNTQMTITDSYKKQEAAHSTGILDAPEAFKASLAWFSENSDDDHSANAWRHRRMREMAMPLLEDKDASWLTVGDGRYGTDANWLLCNGIKNATASDIQGKTLKVGLEKGLINQYLVLNAENMALPDESFDYVFCKEAYHHCPQAPLALSEMLRVAKNAVVLIEPIDGEGRNFFSRVLLELRTTVRGGWSHGFETSGNFIYRLSTLEVEKVMLGRGLQHYAFRSIQDCYLEGAEASLDSPVGRRIQRSIHQKTLISKLLGIDFELGCFVLFKVEPSKNVLAGFQKVGFRNMSLPKNPYS
jgi:ubiquinone/menaquinone biosynthesis C-methylase UbiE